ncbi:spondin domain-containing protein [Botrimarina hoheduenensis]|nr:spondin domain-containing protein [Botrimarina hoheduenensis]
MAALLVSSAAVAQPLTITVENLSGTDGFFLTPVWYGFHNGSFDLFSPGSPASPGLEALAEDGIVSVLQGEFAAPGRLQGVIANPAGFPGAPIIDAGETATTQVTPINPAGYRYFSYASMVIPSNDAFIGNGNPTAYEIFNAAGEFNGTRVIEIFGSNIWDSGTEVNDTFGAAFSTVGGTATDEGGVVALHTGLANFEGTGTPAGFNVAVGAAPGAGDLIARITISQVPEPASLGLIGTIVMAAAGARRRS